MPPTRLSGREIKDESIQRADLDVTSPGQSVITRVINSSDISLSSTGFDPGTGDVTIGLTDTGITPGQYTKITFDAKGRATAGTSLSITDLPTSGVTVGTWTKVTVNAQGQVTVGASLSGSDLPAGSTHYIQNQSTAPQTASIWVSGVSSASALHAYEGTGTYYVGIAPPDGLSASYTFKLPASYGSNNQIISGDGAGGLSWTSLPTSLPPNGSASGDLSGTYPSPSVTGLRGSALPALGASALLRYNGSAWVFDASTYLTANQSITLSGDVTGTGATGITTTIAAGAVTLGKMANLAASSFLGNNTGAPATPIALTAAQAKTLLAITTADITNLGSWAGSTAVVTLGTVTTGTWNAATIAANHGGTGNDVYVVGDLLYADTTTTLARRAGAAAGNALISGGVGAAPTYGKIGLTTHISGTLGVGNGGTGLTSLGTVGAAALAFTSASSGLLAWNGSALSVDTSAYITGNQSITLSGDATGTGTTAITVALASTIIAAGPIGSSSTVPVITYDAKGRLTTVATATITPASIGAAPAFTSGAQNLVWATPAASAGVPSLRALVVTDIPTLNQNTTGTAAGLTTARTFTIGSTGKSFDGTAAVSWTLSEIAGGDTIAMLENAQNFTAAQTFSGGIVGVTNGADAAAGHVGEYVSSLRTQGAGLTLTTNVVANVTTISLTAGDWDVEGHVNLTRGTGYATLTSFVVGINTTSATVPSDGSQCWGPPQRNSATSYSTGVSCTRKRISVTATTTIYMVVQATFSANTFSAYGALTARRVR